MVAKLHEIDSERSFHSIISGYAENFTGKGLALGVLAGDDAIGLFMNLWVNCYAPPGQITVIVKSITRTMK